MTAELSRLAGWTAFDVNQHEAGQRHFIQALRLARAAGDVELGCYVLTTMAMQALLRGFTAEAIDMTEGAYHGSYVPLQGLRMTSAYSSAIYLSFDVRGGLLIRQTHHWAALVFVAAIGVHMLRIFFTGAFRRPREVNWILGVTLFLLAMFEGFCGYSLPDDLLSGTGLRTALTILSSVPIVGTYLEFFVLRGAYPGHILIPRLYLAHILLIPGLLALLIVVHLFLVVYLKHTQWSGRGKTNRNVVGQPMFPQFTAKSTGLAFTVAGALFALGGLAQINPIWIYGPYRADQVVTDAQPDWYVGFLEGALRLMPSVETTWAGHTFMWNVFLPAVVLPAVLFLVLYAYPFFEKWVTGDRMEHHLCDRPRDHATRTGLGVAGIVFYGLLLWAGGNDVTAHTFDLSVNALTWFFRIAVLIGPVIAFFVTKRICLALQDHDRKLLTEGEETGRVTQEVYGKLGESSRPLPAEKRYRILVRDVPRPLRPAGGEDVSTLPRRQRLRVALSSWYFRDRVEMPATPEQRREIAARVAGPEEPSEGGE